jgi:hypothetical protein
MPSLFPRNKRQQHTERIEPNEPPTDFRALLHARVRNLEPAV